MSWKPITRQQQKALCRIYQRRWSLTVFHGELHSLFVVVDNEAPESEQPAVVSTHRKNAEAVAKIESMFDFREYLKFRRTVQKSPLMGCLMVPWKNMWLGIEKDGYTHS